MTNTFNRNDGTFAQVDYASVSGNPALTSLTKATTADITLSTTSYFDGPAVSQGSSGTWFASGTVTLLSSAGFPNYFAKLWDGTTVIASAATDPGAINFWITISLSGVLASPAGNLRISVASSVASKILFNASGNSADSVITAVRIG